MNSEATPPRHFYVDVLLEDMGQDGNLLNMAQAARERVSGAVSRLSFCNFQQEKVRLDQIPGRVCSAALIGSQPIIY